MSEQNSSADADLHGNAPSKSEVVLLLVDVINDLEFEGGEELLELARPVARELASLKERAKRAGVPCIYCNDNFGRWRSDFAAQLKHVLEDNTRGAEIARMLLPHEDDYFVLKVKHSGFYQTCLSILLEHLGARTLLIGGFATDSCVQLTASEAYMRGFEVVVLGDGSAALSKSAHDAALEHMSRVLKARVPRCSSIGFERSKVGVQLRGIEDREPNGM